MCFVRLVMKQQTMAAGKKTVVLGASENPSRYSYLAVNKLMAHQHPVVAVGNRKGKVGNIVIETDPEVVQDVDTVTLYLNPANQKAYYDYILKLKPKRIIFNPGTENEELKQVAEENGIEPVEACTLVLLSIGNY
ncbi:MAG: CoA-binding protein [Chitinophagaceae bacterium]